MFLFQTGNRACVVRCSCVTLAIDLYIGCSHTVPSDFTQAKSICVIFKPEINPRLRGFDYYSCVQLIESYR